jgi:hypothetical protein
VPGLNAYWAKYGCTKCNSYKLFVIEAGCYGNDTKTAFQGYLTKNSVQYFGTWHQEGGKLFDQALGNGGAGNPEYLIKPDKTFKESPSASDINSAGGNVQHECSSNLIDPINFSLPEAINYSLKVFNVQGKLLGMYTVKNIEQVYQINNKLPAGIHFMQVHARGSTIVKTVRLAK